MTVILLLEAMASPISQLLILVIASRALDSANLSQFVLAQSIGNLLTVMGLGMHITEQTETPKKSESDGWRLYTACNILIIPISIIILTTTHFFAKHLNDNFYPAYISGACLSIALIIDQIQGGALRARHMHEAVSRIDLAARIISLPLVYLGAQHTSIGCILAITACTMAATTTKLILINRIRNQIVRSTIAHHFRSIRQIILSSRGPLLQQAGAQMFSSADKVIMAAAGGTQMLGLYAILQQSCASLHLIPAQLLQPTIARVAAAQNKQDKKAQLAQAIISCALITIIGAVILYAARDFIFKIVFNLSHDLTDNESLALFMMILAYIFISAQTPFIYFLQGAGHALQVGIIWFSSGLLSLPVMTVFVQSATTLTDYVEGRLIFGAALIPLMWLTVKYLKNAK